MSLTRIVRRKSSICLAILLAIGLYLRLRYVLHEHYEPLEWDQLEYTKLAIQLLEKGIYAYMDTSSNTLVTPGWPIILVGFFKLFGYDPLDRTLMIIRLFNCFMALGALVFLYLAGRRLFGPVTGLLAAGFATVYPPYIYSASLILTEVPFLTFFTALLYMQVRILQEGRARDHAIAGILLGFCVLIRPNSLPLAAVPYILLYIQEKRAQWKGAGIGIAAFALVMLPWWVRNWLMFHEVILVAKGEAGNPFLGGTDPYFQGTIDWSAVGDKEQFAEGLRRIRQGFRDNPGLWLKWMTIGKFIIFFKSMWVGSYPLTVPDWYYELLVKLHRYLVYVGWVTAVALAPWNRAIRLPAATLLVFMAVHIVFIPVDRYAYGMLPMLMLMAAHFTVYGLSLAWTAGKETGSFVFQRR